MISVNDNGVLKALATIPENVNGVLKEQFVIHANDAGVLRPIFGTWKAPETLSWSDRLPTDHGSYVSSFSVSENGYKCSLVTHDLNGSYKMYVEFALPKVRKTKFKITTQNFCAYHAQQSESDITTFHGISYIKEQSTGVFLYNPSSLYQVKGTTELVLSGGYHKLEICCGYTPSLGSPQASQSFVIALSEQK